MKTMNHIKEFFRCSQFNGWCSVEVTKIQDINEAYERMLKSDVKYCFVIDMASLKA